MDSEELFHLKSRLGVLIHQIQHLNRQKLALRLRYDPLRLRASKLKKGFEVKQRYFLEHASFMEIIARRAKLVAEGYEILFKLKGIKKNVEVNELREQFLASVPSIEA